MADEVAPLDADPPYITGPIELLGTGMPDGVGDPGVRTFAAYHVQLPDNLRALLGIESAASCTARSA